MRLTIVLPTRYGNEASLQRLVRSTRKYTRQYNYVLDNRPDVGYAAKLNTCLDDADGDYVVLLHDDCEVTQGWAKTLDPCGALCWSDYGYRVDTWGGTYDGVTPGSLSFSQTWDLQYAYCPVFSQQTLALLRPFDEHYTTAGALLVDLGLAIASKGLRYKPLLGIVIHWAHEGGLQWSAQAAEEFRYLRDKWGLK